MSGRGCPSRWSEAEDESTDVTLPLLLALERLSPLERAAFLLHDVFGMAFDEVGGADRARSGRGPPAGHARAASTCIEAGRALPSIGRRGLELAAAFFDRLAQRRSRRLKAMLAADVTLIADGGGKRPAGAAPLVGRDAVLAFSPRLRGCSIRSPSQLVR